MTPRGGDTIDEADVGRFDKLAAHWWDLDGPMRALHKFNPIRVGYIEDLLVRRLKPAGQTGQPLAGLRVLDVGCGAGILSESIAALGAHVTGVDPAANNIAVARDHAAAGGLSIDYRAATAQDLLAEGATFDVVLVMEVVEHVRDRRGFLRTAAALARPGGLVVAATLNRTFKSYALGIIGAEYVLGWVPRGTHDWQQFVTPSELAADLAAGGLRPFDRAGVTYDLARRRWRLSRNMDINYMMAALRPA
jgi:2-polyprenyl-6-hydroxyphenyl methylase/3-demethylubiquinone-9 3-methyltransferase